VDNDCDGAVDDQDDDLTDGLSLYVDADNDGYGNPEVETIACEEGTGAVADNTDCDDAKNDVNPGATETCSTLFDDDCDGEQYDEDADGCTVFYPDEDGDSFGGEEGACVCIGHEVYTAFYDDDCDDGDELVNPDAEEICDDGIDNDCSGDAQGCEWAGDTALEERDAVVLGATDSDELGTRAEGLGDMNADGYGDLLVFAPGAEGAAGTAGYFVGPFSGSQVLTAAEGRVSGTGSATLEYVVSVGDLDADGTSDLMVGSTDYDGGNGAVFLWSAPGGANQTLDDLGVALWGQNSDQAGIPASAGDLDGDGQVDLLVSALWGESVYLVSGPLTASAILDDSGHEIRNASGGAESVAGVGDLDGDGMDDIAFADSEEGGQAEIWVVLGPGTGVSNTGNADATLSAADNEDELGYSLAGAGDLDDDGYDDLIAGAPGVDIEYRDSGQVYVFPGPVTSMSVTSAAITLNGEFADDRSGSSISAGTDINGDEVPDIAIGASGHDQVAFSGGLTYLMYGPLTSGSYELKFADGFFEVTEEDHSRYYSGTDVSIGSDFDNDGIYDVTIGAPGDDDGGTAVGSASLFFSRGG